MESLSRRLQSWQAAALFFLVVALLSLPALAQTAADWRPIGPDGGDVRSLTYDPLNPDRVYLGTSAGRLFLSTDAGASWTRFASLGGHDFVLDNMVIDPVSGTMYVGAWSVEDNNAGDVFRSKDGGKTWQILKDVHGKSIRALALSASNPKVLAIGALDGVFRSEDGGETWQRISPVNHAEIKNIESVAIDPKDPDVIYSGTWHLPWKTADGGKTWQHIKQGVIDDSDVFSIIISRSDPQVVYISACSGIYKSENAGGLFRKAQGIPFSARRTRVLQQDPNRADTVYAGTTEGLWRTEDAGKSWRRITAANLIVNDVMIDPRDSRRVTIATDRSGVLASRDAGATFLATNRGFAHRQVAAVLADRHDSNTVYAGLINDKEYGGVFVSHDEGGNWSQISFGLGGRDVFALRQTDKDKVLAGTNSGIFLFDPKTARWEGINTVVLERTVTTSKKVKVPAKGKQKATVKVVPETKTTREVTEFKARVNDLEVTPEKWYAATSSGLLWTADEGRTWHGGDVAGERDILNVGVSPAAGAHMIAAAGLTKLMVSLDGGITWYAAKLPNFVQPITGTTIDGSGNIWITTRVGSFRSTDAGDTWHHESGPTGNFSTVAYDAEGGRILAIDRKGGVFQATPADMRWRRIGEAGWMLRGLSASRGRLFAATAFDGVVAQPTSAASRASKNAGNGNVR
ncbi:MAG: transcriptional regulator [Candidatus Koribacter versatilis]|uniref:Transcriptional regulator n=1 Tax=Candidatus Korobacter versatilis TaxID=658062 RepID=A0A932A878_9BACT|nr:transcriptional regulator [Candidatus Koribacter versatilis]